MEEIDHLENVNIEERITLKCVLKKEMFNIINYVFLLLCVCILIVIYV